MTHDKARKFTLIVWKPVNFTLVDFKGKREESARVCNITVFRERPPELIIRVWASGHIGSSARPLISAVLNTIFNNQAIQVLNLNSTSQSRAVFQLQDIISPSVDIKLFDLLLY